MHAYLETMHVCIVGFHGTIFICFEFKNIIPHKIDKHELYLLIKCYFGF